VAHQRVEITALAALNITQKILDGNFKPGFQTPAKAYWPDLIWRLRACNGKTWPDRPQGARE